jgi:hypothetical protein
MDSLTKVVAIRKWVREQEEDAQYYDARGALVDDTEEPERLLDEQKRGVRSACRRFSYILVGALLSIGEDARIIAVTGDIHRSALEHELVEVWIKELGKWVLVDPTIDALVLIDKHPASALEAYEAVNSGPGGRISFEQNGSRHRLPPVGDYAKCFKHLFVARTNAIFDGYRYSLLGSKRITFSHFVRPDVEPYPQRWKEQIMFVFVIASLLAVLLLAGMMLQFGRVWASRGLMDGANLVPQPAGRLLRVVSEEK